jgi:uncharacterized protein with von Willebrand factor type A (vWA) domain
MIRYRYTIWDGSQEPFRPSPDDLLDGLTNYLLQDGDLHKALRDLMRCGMMDRQGNVMRGMQDVLNTVRATKEELLQQYNPDGVLSDLQRQLDDIVARERQVLDDQLAATRQRLDPLSDDPDAEQHRANEERAVREMEEIVVERQQTLDHLPRDVSATIRQLQQYDFADRQAKADFEALVQSLQQQALGSLFQMMQQRLEQLTSADLQRMRQMLEDLNDLLERRDMGEEVDFQEFLARHRDLFPDGTPKHLDDFLEQLARQMQAMQSLLNSMSEDMRQALQDLLQGQFDDARMQQALADLMPYLQAMMQQHGLGDAFPFHGEDSLSLQEALRLIERLQGLEGLEKQLEKVLWGADPSQINEQQVQALVDDDTAGQVQTLKDLADHLVDQGYIRKSKDKLVLTARGVRKIAERAMRDIFASLRRDQLGKHPIRRRGIGGQRLEETQPYLFGDYFDVDLPRSMMNAVMRSPARPPLHLAPQDFEVYRTESVSRCFTVLLLDMSGSMARSGRFAAAKKVALALDALIRTQFPRDSLAIVGFYTYAQEIALQDLPYLKPKPVGVLP